jgi:hypothetical protein
VPIGDRSLLALLRELTSADGATRESACGTVTDWAGLFDAREAKVVAAVLASAAALEQPGDVRESQMHALHELSSRDLFGAAEVAPLRAIDRRTLDVNEIEYLRTFEDEYGWGSRRRENESTAD